MKSLENRNKSAFSAIVARTFYTEPYMAKQAQMSHPCRFMPPIISVVSPLMWSKIDTAKWFVYCVAPRIS